MTLTWMFTLSAAAIAGMMVGLWLISLWLRDSSIVDIAWGPIFVVVAAMGAAAGAGWPGRQLLVLGMVGLWGLRLGWHIHSRNRGRGEDPRYATWRERHGDRWWWVSLFRVFLLQGAFLWVISLPIQATMGLAGAARFTVWDALGELIWAAGFLYEAIADAQLAAFKADPTKSGVLDQGLWRNSRHPNYFGEAVLWWGLWLPALSVPLGWATVVSPIIMTLLLRYVSGVPLAENQMEGRAGWDDYVRRVPVFAPGPRGGRVARPRR
jgi:steroid 5-alpha reductase family enzyme